MKKQRICIAQLGARRHYVVARSLDEIGILEKLYTDAYIANKSWLVPIVKAFVIITQSAGARRFLGRKAKDIPSKKIKSFDFLGLRYYFNINTQKSKDMPSSTYSRFGTYFGQAVVNAGFGNATAVYGFNGASLEIFEAAKQKGLGCILDQTIIPMNIYRDLIKIELEKWPDWQPNLLLKEVDSSLEHRDKCEWELADIIICGSKFLAESLVSTGVPREKCHVIPYGFTENIEPKNKRPLSSNDKVIKLLFVGEVGLRKGVPYLLEALRHFDAGEIQVKLAGVVRLNAEKIKPYKLCAEFLGNVPRDDMYKLYDWADALVLPSLCEGSSMATYEARHFGLPVICTPNAGADITDGVDGFIVNPGSIEEIVAAIHRLPELIKQEELESRQDLVSSFNTYQKKLRDTLECL